MNRKRDGRRRALTRRPRAGAAALVLGLVLLAPEQASPSPARAAVARSPGGSGATPVALTVHDPALRVTWLADGDLPATDSFRVAGVNRDGSMDYASALAWVSAINAYDGGRGYLHHNDWTLPTTPASDPGCSSFNAHGGGSFGYGCRGSALGSLYSKTFGLQAPASAVAIPDTRTGAFSDFQPYLYWSGTSAGAKGFVTFSFNTGWQGANVVKHDMYVLPTVAGNPFHTPLVAGHSLDASASGKTVYDPGADLTWLADADLAKTQRFGVQGINPDGSMSHNVARAWLKALNAAAWLGVRGWQLPGGGDCGGFDCTSGGLGQLYYHGLGLRSGTPVVATPNRSLGAFHDLQPYLYWACGAPSVLSPCAGSPAHGPPAPGFGWSFSFGNGFEGTVLVRNDLYVIVYYPDAAPAPTRAAPTTKPPTPCPPRKSGRPSICNSAPTGASPSLLR